MNARFGSVDRPSAGPIVWLFSFEAKFALAPWACIYSDEAALYLVSLIALVTLAPVRACWPGGMEELGERIGPATVEEPFPQPNHGHWRRAAECRVLSGDPGASDSGSDAGGVRMNVRSEPRILLLAPWPLLLIQASRSARRLWSAWEFDPAL